jgi:hypothetical protein
MKRLHLDTIEYEFIEDDSFEKDGKTYTFASLKKVTTYKGNKKYQNVTIKHEHLDKFKEFLKDIIGESKHDDEPF